jgi:hypothetical protein
MSEAAGAGRRQDPPGRRSVDIFPALAKIGKGRSFMKDFFKGLLIIITISSAFFFGFRLGKEKERAKIPEFQGD